MCYTGCRTGCEACKPKYLNCPQCGHRNSLRNNQCSACGAELTVADKIAARKQWQATHKVDIFSSGSTGVK